MTNSQIIDALQLTAQLMELHGENQFKARAYSNAATLIENTDKELSKFSEQEIILTFGKSIGPKISQLVGNQLFSELQSLLDITPTGVIDLLKVKGLGPKKVNTIWKELGITSKEELLKACEEGKIALVKGFGEKTQESIKNSLLFIQSQSGKHLYSEVEKYAIQIEDLLKKHKSIQQVSLCGTIRRKSEIIETIEFVVASKESEKVISYLNENSIFKSIPQQSGPFTWRGKLKERDVLVEIYFSSSEQFFKDLFLSTASSEHLAEVFQNKKISLPVNSEEEIYKQFELPYISPEIREKNIISHIKNNKNFINDLIEFKDLKGIIHAHSTYSDGVNALEEMAAYYKELGYEYLGITDHSKSAFYANGLSEERIEKQHQEIDKLNKKLNPFVILKGIESDILSDGSLDYDDKILSSFDFVIASIHSAMNMDRTKATDRLIKAISNPYTTILGHATGRLLLRREGYPIDHRAVLDACAQYNVIVEINANPWRLDLDWHWVEYAIEKNITLCISPDAHVKEAYLDMHYGVTMGRKGGLNKDKTLNAWPLVNVQQLFQQKNKK